jgi:hypothetical protein
MPELEDYNPFRSYAFDSEAKPSNDFREYLPPPGKSSHSLAINDAQAIPGQKV